MKELGYIFFALLFNLCRVLPVREKKIVLFNGHNHGLNGNLLAMQREFERKNAGYSFKIFAKQDMFTGGIGGKIRGAFLFFVVLPYQMATAAYIFLNDNFLPLGFCRPSGRTKVVQLWHGAGAFKKFGLSVEEDDRVKRQVRRANSRLTHLFVTSRQVIPFYREAFGIGEERIYASGIPVTDLYFREDRKKQGKERFYAEYPELRGKKLLLYTPTFRQSQQENDSLMGHFPVEQIHRALGSSWAILVRTHPKYPADNIIENSFCYNLTNYSQTADLYFVSDMLITDYSSTIVEYVLLDKPIILYAYDLEKYDRGFYRDYESTVPGPVARSESELLEIIVKNDTEDQKRQTFAKLQYDYRDSNSVQRIMAVLEG